MPAALRRLIRALARFPGTRVEEPSRGSHWKVYGGNGQMFPIPAHNGEKTEIDDRYVRAMCRALGIDEAELRRYL